MLRLNMEFKMTTDIISLLETSRSSRDYLKVSQFHDSDRYKGNMAIFRNCRFSGTVNSAE